MTHETIYVAANLFIVLGYFFLAAFVVPRVTVRLKRTQIGGVGFFALCGLHHLDDIYHVVFQPTEQVAPVMTQLHMLAIDVPQALCVFLFVSGLYLEATKWGPWGAHDAS